MSFLQKQEPTSNLFTTESTEATEVPCQQLSTRLQPSVNADGTSTTNRKSSIVGPKGHRDEVW
jgi:hypothetical protein